MSVKQIYTDANGNPIRLTMHQYFTNAFTAITCMNRDVFEVDVVAHIIDHMDPQVRANLEASYTDHLKPRDRDWISQTTALQSLQAAAEAAEKHIMNVRGMVRESTTSLMLSVLGYNPPPAGANATAPAMKSVAESTI